MKIPVRERKRMTHVLIDTMTHFVNENMLRLSIAIGNAFRYRVCCTKEELLP